MSTLKQSIQYPQSTCRKFLLQEVGIAQLSNFTQQSTAKELLAHKKAYIHLDTTHGWLDRSGRRGKNTALTALYRAAVACLLATHPVTSEFVDGYRSAVSHSSQVLDFVLSLRQPLAPDFLTQLTRPDASSFAVHIACPSLILFGIPALTRNHRKDLQRRSRDHRNPV